MISCINDDFMWSYSSTMTLCSLTIWWWIVVVTDAKLLYVLFCDRLVSICGVCSFGTCGSYLRFYCSCLVWANSLQTIFLDTRVLYPIDTSVFIWNIPWNINLLFHVKEISKKRKDKKTGRPKKERWRKWMINKKKAEMKNKRSE